MATGAHIENREELLDAAIRGKELASTFFQSLAGSIEDVDLRRCFQRLSQEEWDHRKILLKHRRELFGRAARSAAGEPRTDGAFAAVAGRPAIRHRDDLRGALLAVIRSEREVQRFFDEASRNFEDRAVKVFLRILADEGRAQVEQLEEALQKIESIEGPLIRRRTLARRN